MPAVGHYQPVQLQRHVAQASATVLDGVALVGERHALHQFRQPLAHLVGARTSVKVDVAANAQRGLSIVARHPLPLHQHGTLAGYAQRLHHVGQYAVQLAVGTAHLKHGQPALLHHIFHFKLAGHGLHPGSHQTMDGVAARNVENALPVGARGIEKVHVGLTLPKGAAKQMEHQSLGG